MSTPFLDEIYKRVDFDRELVFKFFTVFSLFEYALRQAGYCATGRSGEAQPNWEDFANAIHPQFDPQGNQTLTTAVDYMLNHPVMKQVPRNNALVFIQRQRPHNMNNTLWISILIRGVRNNLFHGGKFRYERPRDPDLIHSSLIILEAWSQCNNEVKLALENIR